MTRQSTTYRLTTEAGRGLYADLLPPPEPTLLQLASAALSASEDFRVVNYSYKHGGGEKAEPNWDAAYAADIAASKAFTDALCDQTGIPPHIWSKLNRVGVMP